MKHYDHKPDWELTFITENHGQFVVRDVVDCSTDRVMDAPGTQATFVLKGETWRDVSRHTLVGKSIDETLEFYDICRVRLRDGQGKYWTDTLCFVVDVLAAMYEDSGRPIKSTKLVLVGLGQALESYRLFFHPHIAGQNNLGGLGFLARSNGQVPGGRPDQVITQLVNTFFNEKYIFTLADGRKISHAIQPKFEKIADSLATMGLTALGAEGSLWSLLKRYQDAPWNSLWTDIERPGDDNPIGTKGMSDSIDKLVKATERALTGATLGDNLSLHFRPTPFDIPRWRTLATRGSGWFFEYEDSERMGAGELVGRSSRGLFNFFWTTHKGLHSNFDQLSSIYNNSNGRVPIYDEKMIRKMGLRKMENGTEYVHYFSPKHEDGVFDPAERMQMLTRYPKREDLIIRRTLQLQQWFGYPRGMYAGTITLRGRIGTDPDHGIRVGGILRRKRDGMEFFVNGVQQNWSHPGPHTTTISVVQGHQPSEYRKWWNQRIKELNAPKQVQDTILGTDVGIG